MTIARRKFCHVITTVLYRKTNSLQLEK